MTRNCIDIGRSFFLFLCAFTLFITQLSHNSFAKDSNNTSAASQAQGPAKIPTKTPAKSAKLQTDNSARTHSRAGSKIMLWKATAANGATLFLLGTIHVFRKEYYPLPLEMEKAFEISRALMVEIDTSKSDRKRTEELLVKKGIYPSGESLGNRLSAKTLELVQKYCDKSQIAIANLIKYRPWSLSLILSVRELQKLGFLVDEGVDKHFIEEANKMGKKVIALETEEFQLGIFSELSEELQEQMLQLTLVDMDLLKDDAGEMMKTWLDGDEKGLLEISTKDVREHPELAPIDEKLNYERNVTMAKKLEAYLKGPPDDVFIVAVGSAHLIGPRSIVDLLKQKGYKVEQVTVGDKI